MALYELDGIGVEVPANGRYWVAENATVLGRVRIEEDASIWFNAVLRGDTEPIVIGARANVQDGCVLHTDIGFPLLIGDGVTIGHGAILHGCRIGRGSLIGIGAVVLNGAEVGEDCLIASQALIPEGKVIAPRSVVMGSPGKVVRQVTDRDLARMRESCQDYVSRGQQYAGRKIRPGCLLRASGPASFAPAAVSALALNASQRQS
jgi:carbonic anhydrase/acetyltransferase-like protein (isoleucine patch superfamily)